MALIKYLVPYEVTVEASDLKSGKLISNIFYMRTQVQTAGAPQLYGSGLTGTVDATTLSALIVAWTGPAGITTVMSVNYQISSFIMRAIAGRRWRSPLLGITAISDLLSGTSIVFATPHLMSVGDNVNITNVTTPFAINGTWGVTDVPSPVEIKIAPNFAPGYTGSGLGQLAAGQQEFTYTDNIEIVNTEIGDVAGDALPLFANVSVRRINSGVGKNWKSRMSLAPIPEDGVENGKLEALYLAAWNTALGTIVPAALGNGGTTWGDANKMIPCAVSRFKAFQAPTPFLESDTWAKNVSSMVVRPNLGSFVRRKPRLGAVIS